MAQGRLQQTVSHFRQQLMNHEARAVSALSYAHKHTLSMIQPALDRLYKQIEEKQVEGEDIPLSWLYEARRLQSIRDLISNQIDHFSALAQMQTANLQHIGIQLGMQSAQAMLKAVTPSGVRYAWGIPDPGAISSMVGATQAGSPLADLFNGFGVEAADGAGKALITGVSLGWNPRRIAPQVEQALDVPRWRALTIARTEGLRSYRTSQLANYQANSDALDGWLWVCDLSSRSCAVCISMNGTKHDLSEDMPSHVNCRCTQAPLTKSWDDILGPLGIDTEGIPDSTVSIPDGEDWFTDQDEATQKSILGSQSAYDLYKSGDASLSDFVGYHTSEDWGRSIYQKSVKQLTR